MKSGDSADKWIFFKVSLGYRFIRLVWLLWIFFFSNYVLWVQNTKKINWWKGLLDLSSIYKQLHSISSTNREFFSPALLLLLLLSLAICVIIFQKQIISSTWFDFQTKFISKNLRSHLKTIIQVLSF